MGTTDNIIKTRFAPSPTGELHIGGLRTALYSYALAKHSDGVFILRIEDTDKKREVEGSKDRIKKTLELFGLTWDEYYEQSQRAKDNVYKTIAEKMVKDKHAFYCDCKAKNAKDEGYSKELRDPCRDKNLTGGAIKVRIPEDETVEFTDYVLGKKVSWKTNDVADTTILKSDSFPTYHLAVVVDDNKMGITHALRGHDWMPSTPIHLLIYKYLKYDRPQIGHLTDILDPDGGKLSKRKGSTTVEGLLSEGYLSDAILNFVMLLGWAPKDNKELYTLDEFVKVFSADGLQKSNPVYNIDKLTWFSGECIRKLDDGSLTDKIVGFYKNKYPKEEVAKITPLVKDRARTLKDFESLAGFFFEEKDIDEGLLEKDYETHLKEAYLILELVDSWDKDNIDKALLKLIEEKEFKTGKFFMNLRIAITGSKVTPPINESLVILGKKDTLNKLSRFNK